MHTLPCWPRRWPQARAPRWRGPGHDHGDEAPAASGTASPRVTSHSDLFELVGIVDAGVMTVYLDRYASNEPVVGAKVEVEAGAAKGMALRSPTAPTALSMPSSKRRARCP
jgi:hypothetical protein